MNKEELIEQIKSKADSIGTSNITDRRVKGAYVDCLIMVKTYFDDVANKMSEYLATATEEDLKEDLDRIGYFNCLEQNIKGDSFRCENHCGKCVK